MFFKIVRAILGNIILWVDALTRPRPIQRSDDAQDAVNDATQSLSLYQFKACPFCVKTRRTIHRLNLNIQLVDAKQEPHKSTLLTQGGSPKVPCLRIEQGDHIEWMYESKDIMAYLETRFA